MGVVGAAIKGFGKALKGHKKVINRTTGKPFPKSIQEHMYKSAIRRKAMTQAGYKGPTYRPSGKKSKTGAHYLEEVWTRNPYKTPRKKQTWKKIAKKTAPIGAAAAAGEAYGRHREKSKGKK